MLEASMAHPNAAEYLVQAALCDTLVRETRNAEARQRYLEIARAWRTLAESQPWEVTPEPELKSA
jgi:hypothetical protein